MPNIDISASGFLKLLTSLYPSKTASPDSIKPVVLKELANEIAPIVTAIFQLSLDTGTVPLDWKKALVTLSFLSFFRYVLTSEEDVRRGSVNECKRGLAENKRGAQLRKRI